MGGHDEWLRMVEEIGIHFDARGLILRRAEDEFLNGRTVLMEGRPRVNFGSCSYFGLELDPRLRAGAIDAVERYGTQFSCSRAYMSAPPYAELEALLDRLFGNPTVVTPNTTLAHLAALPVLIGSRDAVVLDHQVHTTVRMAAQQVRAQGAHLEILPHNDADRLEARIRELGERHEHVWHLADGVYSMHGDLAPMEAFRELLDRHERFRLYVDDAHGMGWCGPHGRGHTLSVIPHHPHLVVATSLAKCFGVVGGVLVVPDEAMRRRLRMCGGPLLFTGPLQPANLGAAIASARIHLSPELDRLQRRLRDRIALFNALADEQGVPIASHSPTPMRFLATGPPKAAADLVERLLEAGFWTNLSTFPAVLAKQSGARCALNLHQREEDVRALIETAAKTLPEVLARHGSSLDDVGRAFGITTGPQPVPTTTPGNELRIDYRRSFDALDVDAWETCFRGRGLFAGPSLRVFERISREGGRPEDVWSFHYLAVRDARSRLLAASFFTDVIWKDDVFASEEASQRVETLRGAQPDFLISRVLLMGAPLSEGNHLFLDRTLAWPNALELLLRRADEIAEACGARTLVVRDLPADDPELDAFFLEAGFARLTLPDSMVLATDWGPDEDHLTRLKGKYRRFQKNEVLPWEAAYEVQVLADASSAALPPEVWRHLHGLYRNVWARNLRINVFPLPEAWLPELAAAPGWELVLLRLRPGFGGAPEALPEGFLLAHVGGDAYTPLLVGLDYERVRSHGLYRRCVLEVIRRARAHGVQRVRFGMGAELEKRRFGARPARRVAYVRADDHLHLDILAQIEADVACGRETRLKPRQPRRATPAPATRALPPRRAS